MHIILYGKDAGMGRRFAIERTQLPYDAFVADESWLVPIDEEDDTDVDEGKGTETDRTEEA